MVSKLNPEGMFLKNTFPRSYCTTKKGKKKKNQKERGKKYLTVLTQLTDAQFQFQTKENLGPTVEGVGMIRWASNFVNR